MVGTNWSGNHLYGSRAQLEPSTVSDLRELVASSPSIKALGTKHSFNDIADTDGIQVSLARFAADPVVDEDTVTVSAATRYGDLALALNRNGRALHNLASLPHISVAGAIATATHGSGTKLGNLSTAVRALEILRADGELVTVTRSDVDFPGLVVALGAVGIVTRVTLATEPSYDIRQTVVPDLDWSLVSSHFDEIMAAAYSVSLFTDWSAGGVQQVLLKSRRDAVVDLFGQSAVDIHSPSSSLTDRTGQPGLWSDRLPHFTLDHTPSFGEEIQSEYLLPIESAPAAIEALRAIAPRFAPYLLVTEIRTVAADDLWMSTAYGRDSVGIHFTWKKDQAGVESVLPLIEDALSPYDFRPHWGKLSASNPPLPRLADFAELVTRWDPTGRFSNDYLRRVL